ncbi:MAG: hypothetical protein Kow00117_05280 [Phototrophicales bacterium]
MPRLIGLLLVIWGILVIRIDAPWFGVQEAPRTWIPASVRTYHTYGLSQTGGMVFRHTSPLPPEDFQYYTHHPPSVVWLPYALSIVMGDNEVAIRFGFLAATLLSAVLFFVFVRRLYDERVAWWATVFYSLVPMIAYYGRVPGYGQLALFIAMLFAVVMVEWLKKPTRNHLIMLCILAWLAVWTAWTAVFFVAAFGLAAMILGSRQHQIAVVGFGLLSIAAFMALMAFYQSQWDGAIDSIIRVFGWRTSNASDDPGTAPFTLIEFVWRTIAHIGVFMTPSVLIMSIWGIFILWRKGTFFSNTIVLSLLIGSLGYQLVFRNASYVHDYYKMTFAPVMAISAGVAWVYTRNQRWIRPAFDAMLLITLGTSAGLLIWLHTSGIRPQLNQAITLIQTQTTPDDLVLTDLQGKDILMPLRFYSERVIEQAVTLQEARYRAETTGQRVIFLTCPQGRCELISIQP